MTEIPPTADSSRINTFKRLAAASWMAPLLAFALGAIIFLTHGGKAGPASRIQAVVGPGLIVLGLASGIVALIGILKVGRRGVLIPAAIGTTLSLTLLSVLCIPRLLGPKSTPLQPAVHSNGHRVLKDEALGLTLDVPEGFAEFPAGKPMQRADYVFVKGDTTDRELDLLFSVTALSGALPKRRLQPHDLPAKGNATLQTFNWRGLEVDAFVVRENLLGIPFTTFNIQLPTLPRALQISVAGPTARQGELDQIAAALLPTVDARSNW